jgi:DNA-directed RNA polymerase specialized sigma subunit
MVDLEDKKFANFSPRAKKEIELWDAWKTKPTSKNLEPLIESLQPLVNQTVNKFHGAPVPPSAIRAMANVHLMKSIKTYDPLKVGKSGDAAALSTHATWGLKKVKSFVLKHQNVGRIPDHRGDNIADFKLAKAELTESMGRPPDAQTLASHLGVKWSVAEVTRMEKELQRDLIASQSVVTDVLPEMVSAKDRDVLRYIYEDLDGEERAVFEYSFGVNGKPKLAANEIGTKLNMSNPKVSRVRKRIDLKLRARDA